MQVTSNIALAILTDNLFLKRFWDMSKFPVATYSLLLYDDLFLAKANLRKYLLRNTLRK